jgi:uncharacterized protein
MKSLFCAVAALILAHASCEAAPIWNCGGAKKPETASPCADPQIVRLDKAIDARLGRLVATADPVTALLLKRDRRWFQDASIVGNPAEVKDDDERKNMRTRLEARLKVLEAIQPRGNDSAAGEWVNALLSAKITKAAGDALQIEITGKIEYAELDEPAECELKAEVKPGADGWFSGTPTTPDGKKSEESKDKPGVLRLRMQAGTLRVVLTEDGRSDFCTASSFITGSYFATGAPPSSGKPQAVAPSFDCATAKNEDEEEICADPDLAQKDLELAKVYRETLKRLDAKAQSHLREDQRGWAKIKHDGFRFYLHPYWDKRHSMVHHTDSARDELLQSQIGRIEMLNGLDTARKGFAGRWIGYNAGLTIAPKKDEKDGTLTVSGGKWDANDYKAGCEFDTEGTVAGTAFKTSDGAPRLARDGMTLTVDAHYPDKTRTKGIGLKMERPDYCSRLDSAKARLFPIKDDAKVKEGR